MFPVKTYMIIMSLVFFRRLYVSGKYRSNLILSLRFFVLSMRERFDQVTVYVKKTALNILNVQPSEEGLLSLLQYLANTCQILVHLVTVFDKDGVEPIQLHSNFKFD